MTSRARAVVTRSAFALVAPALMTLAACGTTTADAGTGTTNAAGPTQAGTTSTAPAPTTTSSSPKAQPGVGVTASTIAIGIPYTPVDTTNQQSGAGGVTIGNEKADAQIVIDDINAHGGIAGHKIVPVWHVDSQTASVSATLQAECTDFTQDHEVFAVISDGPESYLQCITSSGAVLVDDNVVQVGASTFAKYPGYIEVGQMNVDRAAQVEMSALMAQHYFSPWNTSTGSPGGSGVKIGIVTFDDPAFAHAVDDVMVPKLTAAGYSKPDIIRVAEPQTQADIATLSAALKNAVLRFRTEHVDHVIFAQASGSLGLFFLKEAEAQKYRPRYAATSNDAFQLLISGAGVPKAQFNGAVGAGWDPLLDLPFDQNSDSGKYSNSARQHCVNLMKQGGQRFPDANAEGVAGITCNALYLIRDALAHAPSNVINRDNFLAGLNSLGTNFVASGAISTRFAADQHDGANSYYYYRYEGKCGCMAYYGKPHVITK